EGKIKRPESDRIPNSGLRSCLNYMSNFIGSDQVCLQFLDFHSRHSLSAGGVREPPRRTCACGVSLGLAIPAGVSHLPFQSTMFKILDGTTFAYSLFCSKKGLLKLEVMRMLSKHHSIQRDQLEMITIDQLVPANHLVRKMETSNDNAFH
ncbi:hypothetical protein ACQKML_12490, partial [Peribacillus frigoritolerans]